MVVKRQSIVKTINFILFILLIISAFYISYHTSQYREKFDGNSNDTDTQKISGTTTILNGKNSIPNNSSNDNNAKIKIVNAGENGKSNEVNANYTASPAAIQEIIASPSAIVSAPYSKPIVPPISSDLTAKEKQLFDAFLEKRITDEKIQELIESGILTEQLVEKFLSMIDDLPEGPPLSHAPKTLNKTTPAAQNNANLLEGFCGNNYARANSF